MADQESELELELEDEFNEGELEGEDEAEGEDFLGGLGKIAGGLLGGLVYIFGADAKATAVSEPVTLGTNDHGPVDRDSDQGREGQPAKAA